MMVVYTVCYRADGWWQVTRPDGASVMQCKDMQRAMDYADILNNSEWNT